LKVFVGLFVVLAVKIGQSQGVKSDGLIFVELTGLSEILNGQIKFLDLAQAIAAMQEALELVGVVAFKEADRLGVVFNGFLI